MNRLFWSLYLPIVGSLFVMAGARALVERWRRS